MNTPKIILNLASVALITLSSCDKETVMPISETPAQIKTYVSTHFSDKEIIQVIKDRDGFTKTYDIFLNNGTRLEFNRKNEIIEIDAEERLPDSVIPTKILDYVNTNFANHHITDWELDDRNQKVGLDNDLDLEFTKSGDFLRIDD